VIRLEEEEEEEEEVAAEETEEEEADVEEVATRVAARQWRR
jgi:hypothetical protein